MAKQYNPYHIECLKHDLERMFGRTCKSPADFKLFVLLIKKESGEIISDSTLRRLWGYTKSNSTTRLSTLTSLALTLGYIDWDAYVVDLIRSHRAESDFISADAINGSDLRVGDLLAMRWAPDRLATIKSLGDCRFEVVEQENSKLRRGDTFKALFFKTGVPMSCSDLVRDGKLLGNYIAGEANGLTEINFMPNHQ